MFNYDVVPYAPYWSFRVIGKAIEDIDKEAELGVKYQVAESIEGKTMEIFRQICSNRFTDECIDSKTCFVTGFKDQRYNRAMKELLLDALRVKGENYFKIEESGVDSDLHQKFKVTWVGNKDLQDVINQFNKYYKLLSFSQVSQEDSKSLGKLEEKSYTYRPLFPFSGMNRDLEEMIFSFLKIKDHARLSQVSKSGYLNINNSPVVKKEQEAEQAFRNKLGWGFRDLDMSVVCRMSNTG